MLKVAIIGSQGIPARYGGFEVLAENLVKHLGNQYEFTVYCSGKSYPEKLSSYLGAKLKYIPLEANGPQSIPYDVWSMVHALRRSDILLVLGVSGCLCLPFLKLLSRKPIVVNLDGVDWKRDKWNWLARNFLRLSERVAAKYADYLIGDNAAIQAYIRDSYGRKSALIEYGGDNAIVDLPVKKDSDLSVITLQKTVSEPSDRSNQVRFDKYALGICRIEPENNVDMLLKVFSMPGNLPLVFIGDWGVSEYARTLYKRYRDCPNIQLLDPIWDSARLFPIRSGAALYVHGHSVGGTNPSLVEAMCLGLPIFAYDVIYNRETTLHQAIYFSGEADLRSKLQQLDDEDLSALADKMRRIGREKYYWSIIASKYSELFDRAANRTVSGAAAGESSVADESSQSQRPALASDIETARKARANDG